MIARRGRAVMCSSDVECCHVFYSCATDGGLHTICYSSDTSFDAHPSRDMDLRASRHTRTVVRLHDRGVSLAIVRSS